MKKTAISTDCICDLPETYLHEHGIYIMHFYIHTATGRFRDGSEITSENILEYLQEGNQIFKSNIPDPEEYKEYFEHILTRYEEVVHITTSDKIGLSYPHALASLELLGENAKRVTLINSGQLSSGLGHMVLKAVTLRNNGKSAAEIAAACENMRNKISSSFIVPNADYLYQRGMVSKLVKNVSKIFSLHPVLFVRADGKMTLKSMRLGNYEKAIMRYVQDEFKQNEKIDKSRLFITHAACPTGIISRIKTEAAKTCNFKEIIITKASAAISSNSGPGTVGVLFVNKE